METSSLSKPLVYSDGAGLLVDSALPTTVPGQATTSPVARDSNWSSSPLYLMAVHRSGTFPVVVDRARCSSSGMVSGLMCRQVRANRCFPRGSTACYPNKSIHGLKKQRNYCEYVRDIVSGFVLHA